MEQDGSGAQEGAVAFRQAPVLLGASPQASGPSALAVSVTEGCELQRQSPADPLLDSPGHSLPPQPPRFVSTAISGCVTVLQVDEQQPDDRAQRMAQAKAWGMSDTAAAAWVYHTSHAVHFICFYAAIKATALVVIAVTYVYGTRHILDPARRLYWAGAAVKMASTVAWLFTMQRIGPAYAESRPRLWTLHWIVEAATNVALLFAPALVPEAFMPFQNRVEFLVAGTVLAWASIAGAVSCAVPWERKHRRGTLLPVIWTTSLWVLRGLDSISDLMLARLLYDQVRCCTSCAGVHKSLSQGPWVVSRVLTSSWQATSLRLSASKQAVKR
jgi:hypothetical protein